MAAEGKGAWPIGLARGVPDEKSPGVGEGVLGVRSVGNELIPAGIWPPGNWASRQPAPPADSQE